MGNGAWPGLARECVQREPTFYGAGFCSVVSVSLDSPPLSASPFSLFPFLSSAAGGGEHCVRGFNECRHARSSRTAEVVLPAPSLPVRRPVILFPLDPDCFLIGRACRLCRIWLDRVVVRPLLYQTILHTPQA